MTAASALYVGSVMHRRVRPKAHRLRYRMFSLLLDLDEIDAVAGQLRLFSRNRFNLFSFHDRDYAAGTDQALRSQIEQYLTEAGLSPDGGSIRLLTMPRILGFAFNPLSIYFCHRRDGQLMAVQCEVNNTFGERHSYLLPVGPGDAPFRQNCAKVFHVSPFMAMDMHYTFRVAPPDQRLSIAITVSDGQGTVLTAVHSAERRALTDSALLRVFVTQPLLTLKVVGGILWEALRLWLKGVPVRDHPAPPAQQVTVARA